MRKVRILKSGEVKEVSNNEAFGLIDSGLAKLFKSPEDKMMKPELASGKGYKIK